MKQFENLNSVMEAGNHSKNRAKSKKLIFTTLIFVALICSQNLRAQIALEHTFSTYYTTNPVMFYENVNLYLWYDNHQIKLYNPDYSLYKTITVSLPGNNYSYVGEVLLPNTVYSTNGKIGFVVIFYDEFDIDGHQSELIGARIYDEDATLLIDLGTSENIFRGISIYKVNNNQYRFSITRDGVTEIYSLPVKPSTVSIGDNVAISGNYNVQQPYPNPAKTAISLPYQLKQGETSVMHIYNNNGQLMETKQIDYVFDKILLNVSGYAKGIYFYEVNGVSNRFIVN